MNRNNVVLVDADDHPIGVMEKMEAHEKGLLHRAFSVLLFNSKDEMLLQQRAVDKYHSGGLWTNACCSHPFPGEETIDAANRRLMEELGIATLLKEAFTFSYCVQFENGLTENEFDHVFVGTYEGSIPYNKSEVMNICYKNLDWINDSILKDPDMYTSWFKIAFPMFLKWKENNSAAQQHI